MAETTETVYTTEEVQKMAKAHRGLVFSVLLLMLLSTLFNVLQHFFPVSETGGLTVNDVIIVGIFFVYVAALIYYLVRLQFLASALKLKYPFLLAYIASIITLVGPLVMLIFIILKANKALKAAGVKIGFFGAETRQ